MWFYPNLLTLGWEWSMYSRLMQFFVPCGSVVLYTGIKRLNVAFWFADVTKGFSVKRFTNSIKWFVPLFFVRAHGGSIFCEILGYSPFWQNVLVLEKYFILIYLKSFRLPWLLVFFKYTLSYYSVQNRFRAALNFYKLYTVSFLECYENNTKFNEEYTFRSELTFFSDIHRLHNIRKWWTTVRMF